MCLVNLPTGINRLVAVDTEGSGLFVDDGARVSAISIAYRNDDGVLVADAWPFDQGQLDKPGLGTPSLFETNENLGWVEWTELLDWLSRQRLIMHHAKYDCTMLNAGHRTFGYGYDLLQRVWWDTQIGQWVIEPQFSSALKPTMARLFDDANDEAEALKAYFGDDDDDDKRYDLVPWSILKPYSKDDAEKTYRLFEWQMKMLDELPWLREQCDSELRVSAVLTKMGYRGIGWNVEQARIQSARAKSAMMHIQHTLPFRPPTDLGASRYFYDKDRGRGRVHCTTPTGRKSVAECCVRQLITDGVKGAQEFATLQKLKHTVSNYYDGWTNATGSDGRLRTSFRQAGTISMRFSVERVNLQAIPQDHKLELLEGLVTPRGLFVAREGYELWEFDFSQAEMRIGAEIAGCTSWLKMFERDEDLHANTSMKIFGDAEYAHRQIGKRGNFALLYGVGWQTFQVDLEKQTGIWLSDLDAQNFVDEWRALYPEFPKANRRSENVLNRDGYVLLVDGRRRYFRPYEDTYKAFNSQVQGGLAQTMKRWMVDLDAQGVEILLQIHDSLVCEIPIEHRDAWIEMIEDRGNRLASKMFGVKMKVESKQWGRT